MNIYNRQTALRKVNKILTQNPHYITRLIKSNEYQSLRNFIDAEILKMFPANVETSLTAKIFLLRNPNFDIICPYGNHKKYRMDIKKFVCSSACQCVTDAKKKTNLKRRKNYYLWKKR